LSAKIDSYDIESGINDTGADIHVMHSGLQIACRENFRNKSANHNHR